MSVPVRKALVSTLLYVIRDVLGQERRWDESPSNCKSMSGRVLWDVSKR